MKLELEAVSKTYPNGTQALSEVTLSIPAGMFGLLGPNGAGKSTLMRSIATLQEVDAGSLRFGELDIRENKEALRAQLGYLPQDFGVYPKVTAWDLLDHLAQLKGLTQRSSRHATVKALLHRTNLWDHARHRLGGFSGGMKQRFGIAQALLGDPKLLIVDEPTAGLDPAERARFHNLLAEIGEEVVVLLSTHIVSDVADLCQNMAVMAQGKVMVQGKPQALMEQLAGKIWKKFVSPAELEELREALQLVSVRRSAGRRLVHVYADAAPEGFEPVTPDLEDVYFRALDSGER